MDVLLVDDNPLMQQVMTRFLGELGYVVAVAGRADDALELARQQPPALILMDLRLPDMDGPDAIRAIRSLPGCTTIPAVGISGMDLQDIREHLANDFSDYLSKPVDLDILEAVVARHVSQPSKRGNLFS